MDQLVKRTFTQVLPDGVPAERRINGVVEGIPYGDAASQALHLSTEELQRRNESLIENIGAMRFLIARTEHLEAQKIKYRAMLTVLRTIMRVEKDVNWCKTIDTLLDETEE